MVLYSTYGSHQRRLARSVRLIWRVRPEQAAAQRMGASQADVQDIVGGQRRAGSSPTAQLHLEALELDEASFTVEFVGGSPQDRRQGRTRQVAASLEFDSQGNGRRIGLVEGHRCEGLPATHGMTRAIRPEDAGADRRVERDRSRGSEIESIRPTILAHGGRNSIAPSVRGRRDVGAHGPCLLRRSRGDLHRA